jgi:hypothetical protein
VFTIPAGFSSLSSVTLLEALSLSGGSTDQDAAGLLLHQAAAALLNASNSGIDYPLTQAEVIAQVNAALATGDRDTMLELAATLDTYNNLEGDFCSSTAPTPFVAAAAQRTAASGAVLGAAQVPGTLPSAGGDPGRDDGLELLTMILAGGLIAFGTAVLAHSRRRTR